MAKSSGIGDSLYVSGYDISGDTGSLSAIRTMRNNLIVTGLNQRAHERVPGQRDGNLDFSVWFNDASERSHPVLKTIPDTDRVALYVHGATLGNPAAGLVAKQMDYAPSRSADASLASTVSLLANGYGLEWGQLLTAGAVTHATATNGTTLDGAAATNFGLSAYLEVMSLSSGSPTVKLQDSADDSNWLDIASATFGVVAADNGYRIQIGNGATVRRYVRMISTGTFSNLNLICMFRRCTSVEWGS